MPPRNFFHFQAPMGRLLRTALGCLLLTTPPLLAQDKGSSPFEVQVEGQAVSDNSALEALYKKADRLPHGWNKWERLRLMLESHFRHHGYLEARVRKTREGPAYEVDLGRRYVFGATKIEGLEKVTERIVRRELSYQPGDAITPKALRNTRQSLYALNLFESVDLKPHPEDAGAALIVLRVKEKPTKWIKTGVGFGSDEKERLRLILTHNNLGRRAYRGDIQATVSRVWQEYGLRFVNPSLWDSRTEWDNRTDWRREVRDGYSIESLKGQSQLLKRWPPGWEARTGPRWQKTSAFDLDPAIAADTEENVEIRSWRAGLALNRSDSPFHPRRGHRQELSVERAGGFWGGDASFHRLQWDGRLYLPAGPLVGAFHLGAGKIQPFEGDGTVPVFERYFLGGANSVRGYRERGLGPKDSAGTPLGGRTFLQGNIEGRFPLWKKWSGVVFGDGGQAGSSFNDVQPIHWQWGAGVGLRFLTPLGPLRLDWGHKLSTDPNEKDRWRIHFSLGEAI